MESYKKKVIEAAEFLKKGLKGPPLAGVMLGTGLGGLPEYFSVKESIDYADIPNFPVSTVQSHAGVLLLGEAFGRDVIIFQGRFHLYEGYSPLEVTFPIRVMKELGVEIVILTNASGGLNPAFNPGDLMIINDHINLTGHNPLMGENCNDWGIRFPDMSQAYDPGLCQMAVEAAQKTDIDYQRGVYVGLTGPSLETPSEARFLRIVGGDAVGFSTVHEVICAVHSGIKALGLSIVANVHTPESPSPITAEEVISVAGKTVPKLNAVIGNVLERIS